MCKSSKPSAANTGAGSGETTPLRFDPGHTSAECSLQAASAMKGYEGKTVILKMNDIAPDFVAETTQGTIRLHEWMEEDWVVLFSHPKAFTPVCTSELTKLAVRQSEFVNRSVKLIGVGVDPLSRQMALTEKIRQETGARMNFPIIGDPNLEVLTLYNMLATDGSPDEQSAANPEFTTVRSVFVFGPDKRIRLMLAYPMETARHFDEILRVIDSLRLTALYNTRTLNADDGVVALPIMSEKKNDSWAPGFQSVVCLSSARDIATLALWLDSLQNGLRRTLFSSLVRVVGISDM